MTIQNERIKILKDLLLRLHNGAEPESVQEEFDATFEGVSAIEISLMEHELMGSDSGITFEDVMQLCNVHANLFKNSINEVMLEDAEHPGHPVNVLKQEHAALQAALIRINRIINNLETLEPVNMDEQLIRGLRRQYDLVAQFKRIYDRKEQTMFPIMERYGHDSPPKVMWGVDDEIRDLFDVAYNTMLRLPEIDIQSVKETFHTFEYEFKEMIFKEDQILMQILMETFSQKDWLQVAEESDQFGYAIIKPTEKWEPILNEIDEKNKMETNRVIPSAENQQSIQLPQGTLTVSFEPNKSAPIDENIKIPFGKGYLSTKEANLILNNIPIEFSFVDKDDIFQYYNDFKETKDMIFPRTQSQIGRDFEFCHPPRIYEQAKNVLDSLRLGETDSQSMWFKKGDQFIHTTYRAIRDENNEFMGVLEMVQDIQPFIDLDGTTKRNLGMPQIKDKNTSIE